MRLIAAANNGATDTTVSCGQPLGVTETESVTKTLRMVTWSIFARALPTQRPWVAPNVNVRARTRVQQGFDGPKQGADVEIMSSMIRHGRSRMSPTTFATLVDAPS